MKFITLKVFLVLVLCVAPRIVQAQNDAGENKNTVILMGMIHSGHRTSEAYSLDKVKSLIREIKPDFVFAEIPPDRIDIANRQFEKSGEITESRVKVFPEYVDALYPLTREMEFEIVACAGWTKPMADARRKKLAELKSTQPKAYEEMKSGQEAAEKKIQESGGTLFPYTTLFRSRKSVV